MSAPGVELLGKPILETVAALIAPASTEVTCAFSILGFYATHCFSSAANCEARSSL